MPIQMRGHLFQVPSVLPSLPSPSFNRPHFLKHLLDFCNLDTCKLIYHLHHFHYIVLNFTEISLLLTAALTEQISPKVERNKRNVKVSEPIQLDRKRGQMVL